MRIGMMTDAYKPYVSGVTNYISLNKHELERLGHEVFVFTFGNSSIVDEEKNIIRSPGVTIKEKGFFIGLNYSKKARKLLQTMDVVHVHHPFTSGQLALRYCKPLAIPIIFTNHTRYDLYMQAYAPMLPDGIGDAFLQSYLPAFCRSVDLVISPSQGMEKILRQLGVRSAVKVIPNGVDLQVFRAAVQPYPRQLLNLRDEDTLLVYAGRVAHEKNLQFLLRAFTGVVESYHHVHLLVIGDGPARKELEQFSRDLKISDKVHFMGMVPHEELPGYLASCDFFATASVTEVHPLSIIEAMAVGLPVLGINSPGVSDTIKDSVNGFLSNDDLAGYAVKMARLVNEPETRKQLGKVALADSANYSIERTLPLVLAQYRRLAQEASSEKHGILFYIRSLWEKVHR
jgi:1,2-diacylglycerol 3-alpha-glucosyltransferase